MTADISRHSLRPAQLYTGVVRQQGRLPIDADETESDDLGALLLRQVVAETICSRGSPDGGFLVSNVLHATGRLDFAIGEGSFYLNGTRLSSEGDQWSAQPDWLTMVNADRTFALPAAGQTRTDLVWLLGWDQTVTATEDSELLEPGLGGPDTTARRRAMWRVMLHQDVPDTCPEAFDDLVSSFAPNGTLNDDSSEILSNARLTVGFTQLDPLEDLCRPQAQAGFLGARNEALRVMINAPGRFVWGRDNAAPLYRVQVVADDAGDLRKVRFVNLPRDEFGWPLAGMTVELLRWGSLLDNKEKAAEPLGFFASVSGGFDPADDNSILIETANDAALDAFLATPLRPGTTQDPQIDEVGTYLYLRLWTGGGTGAAPDNPMPLAAADLGETGLTLTFANAGLPGDYWTIAARPNTPTRVLPWALLYGAPPAGPRRMIAPLALIGSTSAGVGEAVDCRHHFRPLCEVGACCRITVGDGRVSFGDSLSIQDAIDRLPEEGGEVCIHPGEYEEHVTISGRKNVLITGCGRTTWWHAEEGAVVPLVTIEGCENVVLRRLFMDNPLAEAVLADVPDGQGKDASDRIGLEDVAIEAADRPAVHIRDGAGHKIRRCTIDLVELSKSLADDPDIGRGAAIFLLGRDLLVEHSRITLDKRRVDGRARMPAGGIHIGGGSRRVLIRDNVITGGNGHGITLGSVQYVPKDGAGQIKFEGNNYYAEYIYKNQYYAAGHGSGSVGAWGTGIRFGDQDCLNGDGTPPPLGGDPGIPVEPESGGAVRDVRIFGNDIGTMGFSGISAHVFSGLGGDNGDLIAVERIRVRGNRILGCMRNEVGDLPDLLRLFTGWGGIALSLCSDAVIEDNEIESNGTLGVDPICGIFFAIAEGAVVRGNRILDNGTDSSADLAPGMRGGIVVGLGNAPGSATDEKHGSAASLPALVIENNIVSAPNSRALRAALLGPCIVTGNRLNGAGRSALFNDPLATLIGGLIGFSLTGADIADARSEIDLFDYLGLIGIIEFMGGDAVSIVNLGVAEDLSSLIDDAEEQRMHGGETLIDDNQITLSLSGAKAPGTLSALFVLSADDVSLQDNQIEIENEVGFFMTNTLVFGATARVRANRFQEHLQRGFLSAITFAFLNNTSHNQSTHCLMIIGPFAGLVNGDNRSIMDMVPLGRDICGEAEKLAENLSKALGENYGMVAGGQVP